MSKAAIVLGCVVLFSLGVNAPAAGLEDTTDEGTGTISARGQNLPDEGMDKAFDNLTSTKWLDFSPSYSWIQYQYADSKTFVVTEYTLTSANDYPARDPMDWNILGSDDGGSTWDTLDTRTGELFTARFQTRSFQFTNSTAYNIYRLEITQVRDGASANSVQLAEIELLAYLDTTIAHNPSPADGAVDVLTDATLSWTAGEGAVSHDVYFGTDFSDVNSAARLPGDLDGSGTVDYNDLFILINYWLADPFGSEPYAGINDDNIVDFFDYALLAQDFSDSASAAFKGNQTLAGFEPGPLALSTTYYWRIDEVNASGTTTTGTVWSFTTAAAPPPLPGQATNPNPANGATGVSTLTDLTWTAGSDATSHDVYFGTDSTPDSTEFQDNLTATTFDPGTLANSTTYYWRIDEKNETGTTTGVVWSFSTGAPVEVHPYLSWVNDPANSIVVNWWNPAATGDSTVDYGLTSSYGSTAYNSTVSNFHHVGLTGLSSGTTYHYRISSSDGTVGNDETFTTSTGHPTSLKFAVFGDTQTNYDQHKAQCDHMVQKNPDFVLHTGDLVEYGDNETDWKNFFKAEQNLVKSRALMPTMGNHEVQPGGQPYYYFFDLFADGLAVPANGMAGYGPRTYSFDYGNSHHIIISSYQINTSLERDWIAADLAAAASNPDIEWIFAYMHKPLYTAGQWPADKTVLALWGPEFDQYGVDIVFAGHNHIYERSYPINNDQIVSPGEGTIYMTCGLGARPGGPWNPGSPDAPFFEAWATPSITGATYITINGTSLTAELIMVNNAVLDTFTNNH